MTVEEYEKVLALLTSEQPLLGYAILDESDLSLVKWRFLDDFEHWSYWRLSGIRKDVLVPWMGSEDVYPYSQTISRTYPIVLSTAYFPMGMDDWRDMLTAFVKNNVPYVKEYPSRGIALRHVLYTSREWAKRAEFSKLQPFVDEMIMKLNENG